MNMKKRQNVMEIVKKGQTRLKKSKINTARLEAEMLASHVLKCKRHHLYLNKDLAMDEEMLMTYNRFIEDRCSGKPIQYIIGYREFMGLKFHVDENVLIPRNDTEVLVEETIRLLPKDREILICDMGTGSGAIGISIVHYMKEARAVLVDRVKKTLDVAQINAIAHGVEDRVKLMESNLFSGLGKDHYGIFNAIVSNPPYIPTGEIDGLSIDVRNFEPRVALDGGLDGLNFYRKLSSIAHKFLRPDGFISLEVGYDQAQDVIDILKKEGKYSRLYSKHDLSGIERVVIAYLSKDERK